MEIGDFFDYKAYEPLATATTDRGQIVVVSNNSTHILVGSVEDESMTDGETVGNARLEASYQYFPKEVVMQFPHRTIDTWIAAYAKALVAMMGFAVRGSSDE